MGLVVLALVPPALAYRPLLSSFLRTRFGDPPGALATSGRKPVVEAAARWLRVESPPTRGFLDATLRPEFGVLTSWDDGHLVRDRAERPTIQDNFGVFGDRRASELAGAYFDARDEEAAYRAAQRLGARYVFATLPPARARGFDPTCSPSDSGRGGSWEAPPSSRPIPIFQLAREQRKTGAMGSVCPTRPTPALDSGWGLRRTVG
ncbi:MAG: hypothetical protein ACREI8_06325 [Myxococcota bacterium]